MEIDWSVFDKYPKNSCECHCGATFRSHSKFAMSEGNAGLVARTPCPQCGRTDRLRRASSDPEPMTLTKDDVEEL